MWFFIRQIWVLRPQQYVLYINWLAEYIIYRVYGHSLFRLWQLQNVRKMHRFYIPPKMDNKSTKPINYYCTIYNQPFKFYLDPKHYLFIMFRTWFDISIPVPITIWFITKWCKPPRNIIYSNLRIVTKALDVLKATCS